MKPFLKIIFINVHEAVSEIVDVSSRNNNAFSVLITPSHDNNILANPLFIRDNQWLSFSQRLMVREYINDGNLIENLY